MSNSVGIVEVGGTLSEGKWALPSAKLGVVRSKECKARQTLEREAPCDYLRYELQPFCVRKPQPTQCGVGTVASMTPCTAAALAASPGSLAEVSASHSHLPVCALHLSFFMPLTPRRFFLCQAFTSRTTRQKETAPNLCTPSSRVAAWRQQSPFARCQFTPTLGSKPGPA